MAPIFFSANLSTLRNALENQTVLSVLRPPNDSLDRALDHVGVSNMLDYAASMWPYMHLCLYCQGPGL